MSALKPTEHEDQKAVFEWAKYNSDPALQMLFAIPNASKRTFAMANWLKAEGMKPGVPDMFLPVARCGFHGLFIEQKVKPNKQEMEQRAWELKLTNQGYAYWLSWSAAETIEVLESYLKGTMK
jgi:hypothetical protein